jgi:hypothetical protein
MKITILLVLCSIILLGSTCDDGNEIKVSKAKLITDHGWILDEFTSNPAFDMDGDGTASTDLFIQEWSCLKDDTLKFYTDGSAEWVNGPIECNQAINLSGYGWEFSDDETKIIWTIQTGSEGDLNLELLTEDKLVYSYPSQQSIDGVSVACKWTRTYRKP